MSSKIVRLQNVVVEELWPEELTVGDVVYRLLTATDDGVPTWELHKAEFELDGDDGADLENGPVAPDICLGAFAGISSGMGYVQGGVQGAVEEYLARGNLWQRQ